LEHKDSISKRSDFMKKIMNDPKDFVKEEVEGIIAAYGDKISLLNDDFRMVIRKDAPVKGKVGIVTGGGSGHLPLFLGYVGEGMLDGCAVGNVFASPASSKMAGLIRACGAGAGGPGRVLPCCRIEGSRLR